MTVDLHSASAEDTMAIGAALGASLVPGDVVALSGDLGAGKTTFCKGVGEAFGLPPDRVVSPSFTIVTHHASTPALFHVDVYRLSSVREAEDIGLEEVLGGDGVCVVEWSEKIASLLPNRSIEVKFSISDANGRDLTVSAPDTPAMRAFARRCTRYLRGG